MFCYRIYYDKNYPHLYLATDWMWAFTRRDFIKVAGAATAGTAAYLTLKRYPPVLRAAAQPPTPNGGSAPKVTTVPGVCIQCPAGCGILVRTVEENGVRRAIKIEGNPANPNNLGKICPKGQIGLQILYDPDRIKGPMKRAGKRGEGKWTQISWDQAISEVADHLRKLRERGEPHKLAILSGRLRGQSGGLNGRFLTAYGSPNDVGHSSICADGTPQAHYAAMGFKSYSGFDWDNTKYLISFGGSFVEAWRPTTRLLRAYGTMRRGTPVRAKIVSVDARMGITAAKADEWVSIKPQTDGAMALAMAHVIVRDKLYDEKFLREHTDAPSLVAEGKLLVKNVEEEKDGKKTTYSLYTVWDEAAQKTAVWSTKTLAYDPPATKSALMGEYTVEGKKAHTVLQLWWDEVLKEATPEWAEKITGVSVETIERLARELATTKSAVAAGERGVSMQTNAVYSRIAVLALSALIGSIDTPGGITVQKGPPLKAWPAVKQDDIAKKGVAQPRVDYAGTETYPMAGKVYQDIPDRILEGKPYELDTIFHHYTNPLFSTPDPERFYRAYEKLPGLIVTFSPYMDETSAYADYILPDHTFLERWQDDTIYPSVGFPIQGLREPAVQPLFDTKNVWETLILLAKAIGGTVGESFPWKDAEDLLKSTYQGIYDSKKGIMGLGGKKVADMKSFDEFWSEFVKTGVWTDPPYTFGEWKRVLATGSGRFEFLSGNLEHKLEDLAKKKAQKENISEHDALEKIAEGLQLQARGEALFLPHWEPPRYAGDEARYPLHLVTYKLMAHAEGRGANTPFLQENLGPHVREKWDTWVEINPVTAHHLGIANGDPVWVESQVGKLQTRAVLFEGARPDTVNMPFELGHRVYGRWAKGRGVNPNEIMANVNDRLGGLEAFSATRVKVYRAEGPPPARPAMEVRSHA
ncbi:MAG: molybdopterin-dependent oxidoreductase [Euryarchaeota archaeon]|nr:molybdopterin-dependent oxidoreductase [Euryarchaeota archaeon]